MKTYLVSVDMQLFSAVVDAMRQQNIEVLQLMDTIGVLSVSCTVAQKETIEQIDGVLAVEEEGTSFAI